MDEAGLYAVCRRRHDLGGNAHQALHHGRQLNRAFLNRGGGVALFVVLHARNNRARGLIFLGQAAQMAFQMSRYLIFRLDHKAQACGITDLGCNRSYGKRASEPERVQ